jgi:hypothetical protein
MKISYLLSKNSKERFIILKSSYSNFGYPKIKKINKLIISTNYLEKFQKYISDLT